VLSGSGLNEPTNPSILSLHPSHGSFEEEHTMTDYANPDALVATDWLEEHLDDPDIRVIEVDEDTTAYEKGHIRGAVGWDWNSDLHTDVGRDYKDQDGFADLLAAAGVGDTTTVVLYGGNNNWFAAYAYWLLKLRGFEQVQLLNGGRKKWELESRELATDVPSYPRSEHVFLGEERPEIRAMRDEVIAKIGSVGMVDVRSPEEFRGEKLARPPAAGAGAGARPHRRRGEHPVGQGRQR
jgi:thiosulfate/3-mercaptopyruvate sulfurtransferase